jgi:hypothetical protein
MCGVNNKDLQCQQDRAEIHQSAPIGKAIAITCKNRFFSFTLSQKSHRYIGFDGKHDYLKLIIFNQTGASGAKTRRSNHQMPIARQPS